MGASGNGGKFSFADGSIVDAGSGQSGDPAGSPMMGDSAAADPMDPGATRMLESAPAGQTGRPAGPPPAYLRIVAGNDVGRNFRLLPGTTLVGRGLDCEMIINDPSVSRKHFNVMTTATGYKMIDLGSGNGTKINGERVHEVELVEGMQIGIGVTVLEFHMEAGRQGAAAAPAQRQAATSGPVGAPNYAPGEILPMRVSVPGGQPLATSGAPMPIGGPPPFDPPAEPMQIAPSVITTGGEPEPEIVEVVAAPKKGGSPVLKIIVIGLALLVVTSLVLLIGAKWGGWFGGQTESGETTTAEVSGEVQQMLSQAKDLMAKRKWEEATVILRKVRSTNREVEGIDALIERSTKEADHEMRLADSNDAVASGRRDEAKRLLQGIPKESEYYDAAQAKLKSIVESTVVATEPDTKSPTTVAAGTKPDAGPTTAAATGADAMAPAASKIYSADMAEALGLFNAGKFTEAADKIGQIAGSTTNDADKRRAGEMKDRITKFAESYRAGLDLARDKKYEEALEALETAKGLNESIGGQFDAEIHRRIIELHCDAVSQALGKKQWIEAWKAIQAAQSLDAADVKVVEKLGEFVKKADLILQAAQKALNDSKNVEAKTLYEILLGVLKEGDARYEEAKGMIPGLEEVIRQEGGGTKK